MNEYDSSRMLDLLDKSHAAQIVENEQEADLLLLNTCSIREKAQEKVFSQLGRWRSLKQKKPNTLIAVGGCVASQEGELLKKRAPFVDIIFGPQTLHRLPLLINEVRSSKRAKIDISFPEIEKFDYLPSPKAEGPCAYVSIQEGCNKFCSYCIVPYTRGKEIDRNFDAIVREVQALAQQNVREVTLLGQNVNAYKGKTHTGQNGSLALLIAYIAHIPSIARIRFTTSHPLEFSDDLIQAYKDIPQLVDHLHLPLQSGSDKILANMKRGHSFLEYKAKIKKLRAVRPNISISSDFIVGFPGETEEDFLDTLNAVAEIGFDNSFSFIYSKRPGTPAAAYADDVSLKDKKDRLARLQELLSSQGAKISAQMLNTNVAVLVTGKSKTDSSLLSGRTENNRVVNFSGPDNLIGTIVTLQITQARANSLVGVLAPSTTLESA